VNHIGMHCKAMLESALGQIDILGLDGNLLNRWD
jgi:hypothetical protein